MCYRAAVITAAVSTAIVGALAAMGMTPSSSPGQVAVIVVVVKLAVVAAVSLGAVWISRRRRRDASGPPTG